MGQAIGYALKLGPALQPYLTNGRPSIDNNDAERALRPVAVGRKNWLFFQTKGSGATAVVLLGLVMTAKAIDIDTRTYLRDVMLRIAREPDPAELTPTAGSSTSRARSDENDKQPWLAWPACRGNRA